MTDRMYNCDAYYAGTPHHPCQDFAVAARGRVNGRSCICAILADGCSSAAHSDVGARVVSFALLTAMRRELARSTFVVERLQKNLLRRLRLARRSLGIPPGCLDATLIGLACDGRRVYAVAWGDGVLCLPPAMGGVVMLEYPSGAPFYPSYALDTARCREYETEFGGDLVVHASGTKRRRSASVAPAFFASAAVDDVGPGFALTAFSDGIGAFRDQEMNVVGGVALAEEFSAFKSRRGKYVERRFRKAMKTSLAAGQQPFDDVSCASICEVSDENDIPQPADGKGED